MTAAGDRREMEGKNKKKGQEPMQNQFEDLKVWQKSMDLVKRVYKTSQGFPKEEQYGLTNQLCRAAVSVPVNIAEGKGRYHRKEYAQFLYTSRGSIYEVMTLLKIAEDLGYLKKEQVKNLPASSAEVAAMLNGLIRSIQ